MTDRCADGRCYAHEGEGCAAGEPHLADCPSWKIGQLTALCKKYRKTLLLLCGVDDVAAEVPEMLGAFRSVRIDRLDDAEAMNLRAVIAALEFLLETEPAAGGAPSEKPGHV